MVWSSPLEHGSITFTIILFPLGFLRASLSNQSLFVFNKDGIIAYFLVYVDDILITSFSRKITFDVIGKLGNKFRVKDLG